MFFHRIGLTKEKGDFDSWPRKVTKDFDISFYFYRPSFRLDWPRKKVTLTVFLITFGAKHNSTHVQLYNIRCTVRLRAENSISQSKTQCDDGRSCGAEFNAIRLRGRPQGDPAREASGPPVTLLGNEDHSGRDSTQFNAQCLNLLASFLSIMCSCGKKKYLQKETAQHFGVTIGETCSEESFIVCWASAA